MLGGATSRLKTSSICVWSGVVNFPHTAQNMRLAGPLKVRSGRREGSFPLRITARALLRRSSSSDIPARTIAHPLIPATENFVAISGICGSPSRQLVESTEQLHE
jgi:hypothetical protein